MIREQFTTFVTSFINVGNNDEKHISWRIDKFRQIAQSGIQICVYLDSSVSEELQHITLNYDNVKIMDTVLLQNTRTSLSCENINFKLPSTDNTKKDTVDYMLLINSKIEFLFDAIQINPWNTEYFAWIDFSISHVFKNINECNYNLQQISHIKTTRKLLLIPGCLPALTPHDNNILVTKVYWRFCGGFFWGDKNSILEMYDYQMKYFPVFLNQYNTLVWEVNIWAWLETNTPWKPLWYKADHNDSIIQLPFEIYSISLNSLSISRQYPYPLLDYGNKEGTYIPGSASYLKYNGIHLLNTRYINYTVQDKQFFFHHPNKFIITKNVFSLLDDHLNPTIYQEMLDPPTHNPLVMFNGIEDIRLYNYSNQIRFIGTSMSHSTEGRNSIVIGIYDTARLSLRDFRIIESPNNCICEKNWTPIIHSIDGVETEFFIYKWYPMQIGKIIDGKLQIEITYNLNSHIFRKLRGSSIFVPWGEFLIGLVHFSEGDFLDRKYFHMLIMLNAKTFSPLKYSQSFYFGIEPGIEFCIGFSIIDLKYQFWISQSDRDPHTLSLPINMLPFSYDVIHSETDYPL